MDQNTLIIMGLAALAVGAVAYAVLFRSIESEKKTDQRLKTIGTDRKTRQHKAEKKLDEASRRKQREEALKTVDGQRSASRAAKSPPLAARLRQAGMQVSAQKFIVIAVLVGVFAALAVFLMGMPLYAVGAAGVLVGFGLPNWFVNMKRKKRLNAFIKEFPNAVDVIVRGIRSGLPLNDCIRIIANDAEDPVRSEFRAMVESQQLGLSMPDACGRLAEAVPSAETNFFAIVISIQAQAGGNLGEALGNLSGVLRERAKMKDKIQAVSSEAKASAYIIGALPFLVAVLVHLTTPGYLNPLWETDTGHTALAYCVVSYGLGVFIMRNMINFDF